MTSTYLPVNNREQGLVGNVLIKQLFLLCNKCTMDAVSKAFKSWTCGSTMLQNKHVTGGHALGGGGAKPASASTLEGQELYFPM